jgi:hypothetical protein
MTDAPEPSEVVGTCDIHDGLHTRIVGTTIRDYVIISEGCYNWQPLGVRDIAPDPALSADVDAAREAWYDADLGDCDWGEMNSRARAYIAALEAQLTADVPELEWTQFGADGHGDGWFADTHDALNTTWYIDLDAAPTIMLSCYRAGGFKMEVTMGAGDVAAAQSLAARIQREIDREGNSK